MMIRKNILFLTLLVCSVSLLAQKRVDAEYPMQNIPPADKRYTMKDHPGFMDFLGLYNSDLAGEHHSVGMYAYGAYSTILSSTRTISSLPGGFNTRLGALYEYRYNYLTVQTGIGVAFRQMRVNVNDYRYTNHDMAAAWDERWNMIFDTWGMPISTLSYTFTNRQDFQQQMYVQLPILVGAYLGRLYALGGFTFSLPVMQQASTSMLVTSRATYDRYYGMGDEMSWGEMDNHGYRKDVPLERKWGDNELKRKLDVLFSLELGYDWAFQRFGHVRAAAFVDMGILNMSSGAAGKSVYIPFDSKWDFDTFSASPIWYSDVAKGNQLHDFSAGIKLTLFYTFPQPEKCVLCFQRRKK